MTIADIVIRLFSKYSHYKNFYLWKEDDDTLTVHDPNIGKQIGVAFPLPEGHGRLIDADEIKNRINRKMSACKPNAVDELTYSVCIDIVNHADPIVPAEGGTDNA